MPAFDRTGPSGQGPLTGRGLGPCGTGRAYGRGYGRAWSRPRFGFFWGRRSGGIPYQENTQTEKDILKEDAKALEDELKTIKKRLEEIENK
jgi:hypothetical protein